MDGPLRAAGAAATRTAGVPADDALARQRAGALERTVVQPRGRRPGRGAAPCAGRAAPSGRAPARVPAGAAGVTGPALGYFWGDDEYGLERGGGRARAAGGRGRTASRRSAWRTTGRRDASRRDRRARRDGDALRRRDARRSSRTRARWSGRSAERDALLAAVGGRRARQRPRLHRADRRDRPAVRSRSRISRPPSARPAARCAR